MANREPPDTPQHETAKISALPKGGHAWLNAGEVLLDRYQVVGLLGQGGMGSVFHIKHLHLKSDFALKVLNKQADKVMWRRFENEARAASRLDHPNLIKVYDSGLLPDGQIEFPQPIEVLLSKLLEKEPPNRHATAQMLTAELVKLEQGLSDTEIESIAQRTPS